MNSDMKEQIKNKYINENSDRRSISQFFRDITYNCIPKNKYKYRLFVLIGYNIILNKTALCALALIMDEKTSTFLFLFNKLKLIYDFNPTIMICDFQVSLRTALKIIFKEIKIYHCYYHFIRSIRKNLLKHYKKRPRIKKIFINCLAIFLLFLF